jgi:hypothetical protein
MPATARADLDRIGFQSFRHTRASVLLDLGKNIRQEAPLLGQEDPAFTLRTYTRLMDAGLRDASSFLATGPSTRSSRARSGSARVDAVNVDAVRAMVACELETPDRPQRARDQNLVRLRREHDLDKRQAHELYSL